MAVVRTEQGTMLAAGKPNGKETLPFTSAEAKAAAKSANDQAENLGIKTRYVVAEA